MPHLLLEYSDNILESNFDQLFQHCHTLMVNQLPTQLESCKSRALKHDVYYLGDGAPNNAFVSVHIKILSGRNADLLQKMSLDLMKILKNHFSVSLEKLNCQVTLEISEIGNFYFKSH